MAANRRVKPSESRWITALVCLAVLALIFMIVMVVYVVKYHKVKSDKQILEEKNNKADKEALKQESLRSSKIFGDLTKEQYAAINKFMVEKSGLDIVSISGSNLSTNYVHSVVVILPPKSQVLKYLDGEIDEAPIIKAKVTVYMGKSNPKVIKEVIVYPVDSPTTMEDFVNPGGKVPTWQSKPPESPPESYVLIPFLAKALEPLTPMLKKHLEMWFDPTCYTKSACLYPLTVPKAVPGETDRHIAVVFIASSERTDYYVWPVPLTVVTYTPGNGDTFAIKNLFYDNIEYHSVQELVDAYNNGSIRELQPDVAAKYEDSFGSPYRRGVDVNPNNLPPPTQETSVRRFSVNNRHVKWLGWEYDFIFSPLSSAQLYNVKFNGERIAYHLGMQDVYVKYTGPEPNNAFRNYMDVAWNLGLTATPLIKGYDCPESAEYISGTVYEVGSEGGVELKDAICVFEYRNHAPLRRHRSAGGEKGYRFHMNLPDVVLVFRQILTVFNYDYIVDVELHQTGVIQMSVYPTGYIQVSPPADGIKYGYDLLPEYGIQGLFHTHFFLAKVDLDIGEGLNRFKTLDLESKPRAHPYNSSVNISYAYVKEALKTTEQEATVHYDFAKPKEYVLYSNFDNNTRNLQSRGYRLQTGAFVNGIVPSDDPLLTQASWTNHQIAVTKYKDDEPTTLSYFSQGDPYNPVISLKYFQEDNGSILDEDLVCWVTLGVNHIPTAEDLPVTTTAGKAASLYLIPHNYYVEDPSIASRDAIVMDPR